MNRQPYQREGFSLAELMIAIAILGIGLLMVAASFPVGLNQSQIVADETIGPLVAREAISTLRQSAGDVLFMPPLNSAMVPKLAVPGSEDRFYNNFKVPPVENNKNWEEWYREVFKDLYDSDLYNDPESESWHHPIRVYPAGKDPYKAWDEAQYTWSFAYQRLLGPYDIVQVVIFVSRGHADTRIRSFPVLIECELKENKEEDGEPPDAINISKVNDPDYEDYVFLTEGCLIVEQEKGEVYKVGSLVEEEKHMPNSSKGQNYRTKPPFYLERRYSQLNTKKFWAFIMPVTEDGRSPVIGIYKFYLKK